MTPLQLIAAGLALLGRLDDCNLSDRSSCAANGSPGTSRRRNSGAGYRLDPAEPAAESLLSGLPSGNSY